MNFPFFLGVLFLLFCREVGGLETGLLHSPGCPGTYSIVYILYYTILYYTILYLYYITYSILYILYYTYSVDWAVLELTEI
jgi:hypothetical protein